MSKQLITFLLFLIFFISSTTYYYYWTVPANSIWYDQRAAIEVFQKIIDGQFPLVGYNHSIGIPSFAAFYYIFSPVYYFLNEPIQLYYFTAFINVLSILILSTFLYLKLNLVPAIIFGVFSVTNIWGLYYGSFFWNPNFIPFFMAFLCIFILKFFETKKVIYFHLSGLFINLITQFSPQAIILVFSFGVSVIKFKKLPKIIHLYWHCILHLILVSPWLVHTLILHPKSNTPSHGKLFKDFSSPLLEYTSYVGGWGLTQEWGKFLDYGTIISQENFIFIPLLLSSTTVSLLLIAFLSLKYLRGNHIFTINKSWANLTYFLCLTNICSLFFFVLGIRVNTHHFQFLTPTLGLILIIGLCQQKKYLKLYISLLLFIIFSQGTYSYWRAYSESIRPYITDIGYQEIFSDYVKDQCSNSARVRYVTPNGIHGYMQYGELEEEVSSCDWMLVQKNHYDLSIVIHDLLNEKFQLSQINFKDYLIWIPK